MTAPIPSDFVPTLNCSTETLDSGVVMVTDHGVTMPRDQYIASMIAHGMAHNVNEGLVRLGFPQDANLPPAPDGTGKPTFTVPAQGTNGASNVSAPIAVPAPAPSPALVIPAAPHPSAPPEVHASWLHNVFASLAGFFASPMGAALVAAVPPQYNVGVGAAEAAVAIGEGLTGGAPPAPASLNPTSKPS